MSAIIFKEFHSENLRDSDLELVDTRNSLNIHQHFKAPIQLFSKANEVSMQTNRKMPLANKRTEGRMPTLGKGFFRKSLGLYSLLNTILKIIWIPYGIHHGRYFTTLSRTATEIQGTEKLTLYF